MAAIPELKLQYEQDGFLSKVDLFDSEQIAYFRSQFDELEAREGKETCQIGLQARHFQDSFIWDMASDPRLLDLMVGLVGSDLLLLSTHFFCKYPEPEGKRFVAWHQDITYWGLEPPEAHTAWIAVDDSDVENGCMKVIPGTHKGGIVTHGTSDREGNLLSIQQEIPAELVEAERAVDLELRAGQISVHEGRVFHASLPNTSNRRRCGLTVRFVSPGVRQTTLNSHGQSWTPILVRGEDTFKAFTLSSPPFPFPEAQVTGP
jgi:hypothetical protein